MLDLTFFLAILVASILFLTVGAVLMIPYLYLTVAVYPWLCMHPVARGGRLGDRGVRRVVYPGGRGVVYTPDPKVRRYLSQYALFTHEGCKYIRCAVDTRVAYVAYDVVTFDARGRLLDIVAVEERPEVAGQTHPVRLPTKTAYARLYLKQVDGLHLSDTAPVRYDGRGMLLLTVLTVVTTMIYAIAVREALAMAGTYMKLSLLIPSAPACGLLAVLIGGGVSAWVIFRYQRQVKRRLKK